MNLFILLFCTCLALGMSAATAISDTGGDICTSAGHLCGDANCTTHDEGKYFTCDCGVNRYFNATAQRCYHIDSCMPMLCYPGKCLDNDGNNGARCDCSGIAQLTPDCLVDTKFSEECANSGGEERTGTNGTPECVCPRGTKLEKGVCKSIACLYSDFTCTDICNDAKLREDDRCCQKWETGLCNAHHEDGTYCVPGTIAKGELCTNVCEADQSDPICEHGCTYKNASLPGFTCNCGGGQEQATDGLTCTAKLACNEEETATCEAKGRKCVYEDRQVNCECPEDSIEIEGVCSENCTIAKQTECETLLSKCVIHSGREACACDHPLKWDDAKKQCVLDKEFRYVVTMKPYQQKASPSTYSALYSCLKRGELIDKAMKSLYGSILSNTKIVKCGEMHDVELVFTEEPLPALLNRIQQCENEDSTSGCYFPPGLYIVSGTASDPQPVDLCTAYLSKTAAVSKKNYQCQNEGGGAYSLLCSEDGGEHFVEHGLLKIQVCDGAKSTEIYHATVSVKTLENTDPVEFDPSSTPGQTIPSQAQTTTVESVADICGQNSCPEDCLCEPVNNTGYKCICRPDPSEAPMKPENEEVFAPLANVKERVGSRVWAGVGLVVGILLPAVVVVVLLFMKKSASPKTGAKTMGGKDFHRVPDEEC